MIIVVPNVGSALSGSKRKIFLENVTTAFESATTTYLYNTTEGNYKKTFCAVNGVGTNKLDIDLDKEISYKIVVNSDGEVVSLIATDGEYTYTLNNNANGYKKSDLSISNVTDDNTSIECI